MKATLQRLVHKVGRRGAFLTFLALLDLVYAYSLFFPTEQSRRNPTSLFLADIAPLWFWGVLWGAVGLACAFFVFRRKDAPAFAAAMFIKVLWSLTFLIGWIVGLVERGYLSTAIWGAFALVVALISTWPEPGLEP